MAGGKMMDKRSEETFSWDAEDYRQSSSQQKKWGRELLLKLHLAGDERVLDIGCGDGKLTAELAGRLPRGFVLGIDSSEEMIGFAREAFPPERYPNLAWEVRDARDLDYEDRFDVVFSNAVLHWIRDHLPVLEGIERSMKPGGVALLQMGGKGNAAEVVKVMARVMGREEWSGYFKDFTTTYGFYGPEEYTGWLIQVGLTPKRVEFVFKDMVHKGREGLAAWIRTTWLPFTQRIPEDLRARFIYEIVDGYIMRYPADADGLVHVEAIRLEVEAGKRR